MLTYWLLFLFAATMTVAQRVDWSGTVWTRKPAYLTAGWLFVWLALTMVIGYRHEVGGDWFNYLNHLFQVQYQSLGEVLSWGDPGYYLLNWISAQLGWGIYGVNVMAGALFAAGLVRFCRTQPRPWLALAVAVPYVVIVVAMGYSRQGVALGLAMLGLVALMNRQTLRFVVWILLAATFHKSAVILLPIAVLAASGNRFWAAGWLGVVSVLAYYLFLDDSVEQLYRGYVEAEYQSEGAMIRVAMNVVPALLFLWFRKRFAFSPAEYRLWFWFSVLAVFAFVFLLISPSSTAVDRVALYLLPIQLVLFSRLPEVLGSWRRSNEIWVLAVLGYYALVQFVWLNFASHANAWLPYQFGLLRVLFD